MRPASRLCCRAVERALTRPTAAPADLITTTLHSGGSILLPTDPSARLFELLVLLETHWRFANLGAQFPLCLISRTGKDAVGFVRSLTEWMGGQLAGDAAEKLKFRCVGSLPLAGSTSRSLMHDELTRSLSARSNLRIFSSLDEIAAAIPPTVPKLILTVPSTLSYGFSRALFLDFARTPANLVLLTGLSEPGSLSRWLAKEVWEPQQDDGCRYGQGRVGKEIQMDRVVELEVRRPLASLCPLRLRKT